MLAVPAELTESYEELPMRAAAGVVGVQAVGAVVQRLHALRRRSHCRGEDIISDARHRVPRARWQYLLSSESTLKSCYSELLEVLQPGQA
jgi:hypothetical protein